MRTDQGSIVCEHVVSATGNHARQTGAMVGLDVPVVPVEHQYIVTEPHPDIVARHEQGLPEMGVLRESDASYYMREERGGLLLGPYEAGAPGLLRGRTARRFRERPLSEDLERLEPHVEAAIRRVPAFGEIGIKQIINGPFPTRRTAARSSARPGTSPTSGSTRATASGLPRRAAPAGRSRSGWSRASPPST